MRKNKIKFWKIEKKLGLWKMKRGLNNNLINYKIQNRYKN